MSSTGTWEPTPARITPDVTRLQQWAAQSWDSREDLSRLEDLDLAGLKRWIGLPAESWADALEHLSADELIALMRLFTLAESHLSGCEGGEQCAVIHLFRYYRRVHGNPDRTLVRWIKANTENRFLPYGPVL